MTVIILLKTFIIITKISQFSDTIALLMLLNEMISQVLLSHIMAGDKPTLTGIKLVNGSKPQFMCSITKFSMEVGLK